MALKAPQVLLILLSEASLNSLPSISCSSYYSHINVGQTLHALSQGPVFPLPQNLLHQMATWLYHLLQANSNIIFPIRTPPLKLPHLKKTILHLKSQPSRPLNLFCSFLFPYHLAHCNVLYSLLIYHVRLMSTSSC